MKSFVTALFLLLVALARAQNLDTDLFMLTPLDMGPLINQFPPDDQMIDSLDQDVDFLLSAMKPHLPRSVLIQDIDTNYAYNCVLHGLELGVNREGNATLEVSQDESRAIHFNLFTTNLTVRCLWMKTVFTVFNLRGDVEAYINWAKIEATMMINFTTNNHPMLEELRVTSMPDMSLDVKGAGFLNWIGECVMLGTFNDAKDKVGRGIEEGIAGVFQDTLDTLQSFETFTHNK